MKTYKEKGYCTDDFYRGCTLYGDANEFAIDIIDAAVNQAVPDITQQELNKTTNKLYQDLHKRLPESDYRFQIITKYEIFSEDGADVFSLATFAGDDQTGFELIALDDNIYYQMNVWPMQSIWSSES